MKNRVLWTFIHKDKSKKKNLLQHDEYAKNDAHPLYSTNPKFILAYNTRKEARITKQLFQDFFRDYKIVKMSIV